MSDNYALILAGGKGTRFWPKSRLDRPKQFLSINGSKSFIQLTFERVANIVSPENIYVVTAGSQVRLIQEHLPFLSNDQIIVEPVGRNTCPAIALGAAYIRRRNQQARILVIPSDQLIRDEKKFTEAAEKSMVYASDHTCIVLFGIKPSSPHTGYGYIKAGQRLENGFYRITEFVEKPDQATALQYVQAGNFYWNSGMFIFPVGVFFEELAQSLPRMREQMEYIRKALGTPDEDSVIKDIYPQVQEISIDYGIMEKSTRTVLHPLDIGWNDVGSWSSLYDVLERDGEGNYFKNPDSVAVKSKNVIAMTSKMVAAVGTEDIIIVETDDTLLVCHKDKAQSIKAVLDELKQKGKTEYL